MGQADTSIEWARYQILGKLAGGALATIHLARHTDPEGASELRVIKRLHASFTDSPRVLESVRNETRRATLLRHQHIARVYGFGDLGSRSAIVMEFVDGRPLLDVRAACERKGRQMPRPLALQIFRNLCEALDHAHRFTDPVSNQRQILHHGVSLENIMVTYAGEVKVTNFGMAKIGHTNTFVGRLEHQRSCPAPELIQGTQVDRRLDIFGAGVVFYEMLLGRMPWSAQTYTQLLRRILASPPLLPTSMDPDLPQGLERILLRALQQQRERRYQSISDLEQDLVRQIPSGAEQDLSPPENPTLAEFMGELFPIHRDTQRKTVRALATLPGKPALADADAEENPLESEHTRVKRDSPELTRRSPRGDVETSSTQVRSPAPEATRPAPLDEAEQPITQVTPPPNKSGGDNQPRPLPLLAGMNPGLSLEQTPIVHIENLQGLLETVREAKEAAADQAADPQTQAEAEEPTRVRSLDEGSLQQGPLLPVKTPAVPISLISPHLRASRFKDTGKVQSISGQVEEESTTVRGPGGEPALTDATRDRAEGEPTAAYTPMDLPGPGEGHPDEQPEPDPKPQPGKGHEQPGQGSTPDGLEPITQEVIPREQRSSSRWALRLFLLGLFLLAAGGLWTYLRGDETRDRRHAPAGALAQLKPAQRAPDLGRSVPSSSRPGPPGVADGAPVREEIVVSAPTGHRSERPTPAGIHASEPRHVAPPSKPPGSTPAQISILALQPGVVFLDGKRLGALPVSNRLIPPGQHRLLVRSRHHRYEVYRLISVKPGARRSWRITPARGTIKVLVHPWAKVFLDGKKVGITPLKPLSVYQGSHTLRLENSKLGQKKSVRVVVRPGKTKVVKVRLGK